MSRITDKTIRPQPLPGEQSRRREPRLPREAPLPPGARMVGTELTPAQLKANRELQAIYRWLKEDNKKEFTSDEHEARLKGWKKRQPGKGQRHPAESEDEDEGTGEGR